MRLSSFVGIIVCCLGSALIAPTAWAGEGDRVSNLEKDVEQLKRSYQELTRPEIRKDSDIPRLRLRGFGSLQYDYEDKEVRTLSGAKIGKSDANNFNNGELDLFITSQIANKLNFINETVYEFGSGGTSTLDVERLLVKYEYADAFNVSVGRGHTALGYWNQRFHHGNWLQTTSDRPLLYKFEDDGGILPVHYVGLEFSGYVDAGVGSLTYIGNVANGRGKTIDDVQLIEDANDEKQLSLMLTLEPDALPGLGFGFNAVHDVIPEDAATPGRESEIEETLAGVHIYYIDERFEFIYEHQWIHHNFTRERDHSGGYVQFAVAFGQLKPYYRFDFLRINLGDPFFDGLKGVEDSDQHTVGLRYDWFPFAALKFEYRNLDGVFTDSHSGTIQLSFAF